MAYTRPQKQSVDMYNFINFIVNALLRGRAILTASSAAIYY